jgi:uncharacterized protein YyaL (SSP411 family)
MERESFEDPIAARALNDNFISIKVDREERPDLDQIYMTAVQLLTGQGGWPMSVFLTPQQEPFYGGTYFPPDDRYGRPSFKRLVLALADAWRNKREEILRSSAQLVEHLRAASTVAPAHAELGPALLRGAASHLGHAFDRVYGGFGSAPKFPHAVELRLLLRAWKRFQDDDALNMVRVTLDRMAMGGIYDQLGGGFHRYSTDERWLVPHFEKMLYDNALLALAYLEAFQATREPLYREVVCETLGYVEREMLDGGGAFYSTQDADSEGEEGKFFVWSAAELEALLGSELADLFSDVYGVTADGNWEGKNILHRSKTYAQQASLRHMAESDLRTLLAGARAKLLERRGSRVPPGRDDKLLTAWNGLMIDAFAQAARPLKEPAYATVASRAAQFILDSMRAEDGRLYRTGGAGAAPKLVAYLDDYTFFINALVSLYQATFEARWIESALELADVLLDQFWDPGEGGFFYTGKDHERLITRSKDSQDSSIPSGNSMAASALLRLAKLTGRTDYIQKAEVTLRLFRGLMAQSPLAGGHMLLALDYYFGPVEEFAVVGDPTDKETKRVLELIDERFLPNKILALLPLGINSSPQEKLVPILADKKALGPVTTYICRDYACQTPLVGEQALAAVLADERFTGPSP